MTRYRKRPVEVDAWQIGSDEKKPAWLLDAMANDVALERADGSGWLIRTLEGDHFGNVGDYIIQGVKGELYPCKPDIFEQTYESSDKPYYLEVYDWAFSSMECCDEPEFTMFDEICFAIGNYIRKVQV